MRKFESSQKDESRAQSTDSSKAGVGKCFLRRNTLKILLLPRAACSYYIYYMYNRFENLKKVLHELLQNEGNNSHFRLSKNAVSNQTSKKKLHNSDLIDKITLTQTPNMYYLCTCDYLRAAQNALAGRSFPSLG